MSTTMQKLDHYKHQLMGASACELEEMEVLEEKVKNLEGMMMGCQQQIVALEGELEKEELLMQRRRGEQNLFNGMHCM